MPLDLWCVKTDETSWDILVGVLLPVKCIRQDHTHHKNKDAHSYVVTSSTRRNAEEHEEHDVFMEQIFDGLR